MYWLAQRPRVPRQKDYSPSSLVKKGGEDRFESCAFTQVICLKVMNLGTSYVVSVDKVTYIMLLVAGVEGDSSSKMGTH